MGTMKTEGTVGKDGMVRTRTTGMGAVQDGNMAWPKGAVMAEGLRLIEMEKGLKEGTSYDVNMFSPGANGGDWLACAGGGEAGGGFIRQGGDIDEGRDDDEYAGDGGDDNG